MNRVSTLSRSVTLLLVTSFLITGCVSTTMIQTVPEGAKLYLDGEVAGTTPYTHSDTKIIGSTTMVRLEKEGYETLHTSFSRNEEVDAGAVVGGLFVMVPFLWTMKYKPTHTYELKPLSGDNRLIMTPTPVQVPLKSKADRIRELKQLLDEKMITQEEYDKQRTKILEEK